MKRQRRINRVHYVESRVYFVIRGLPFCAQHIISNSKRTYWSCNYGEGIMLLNTFLCLASGQCRSIRFVFVTISDAQEK